MKREKNSLLAENSLFLLLRLALGAEKGNLSEFTIRTSEGWSLLYSLASKLGVVGIAYAGICLLPKELQPPMQVAFQWASEAEAIRGHNRIVNQEAARLTEIFSAHGRKSAILKGAANARLYPDAFIRQCGDIDIWVDGGYDEVVALLQELGMMPVDAVLPKFNDKKSYAEKVAEAKRLVQLSEHHVHLPDKLQGVTVEVHYKCSSGNYNPISNRHLLGYLDAEIRNATLAPEGFYVPSMGFALAMQLSHVQRHFFAGGIGLKQLADYSVLLRNASEEERREMAGNLRKFGFMPFCGAFMWLLGYVFGLERERMLCSPDEKRGRLMLERVVSGGTFGFYAITKQGVVSHWIAKRTRSLRFFWFSPIEVFWTEVAYWRTFFRSIPIRIKLRKLSIRDLF